jgi:radical SAM superfamily enzyme YgiQ (UPF0313 family)
MLSFPTFVALAQRWRSERPDGWVVFGGPSAREEMFELAPYQDAHAAIDVLCVAEGEAVIGPLVRAWPDRARLRALPGMAAWDGRRWVRNAPLGRLSMDDVASPYQLGLLPPGTTGQLETYRGCPMQCSFCQWGVLPPGGAASKEYLVAELGAMKAMGSDALFIVDAGLNLNTPAFRNLFAAEQEVGFVRNRELVVEVYPTRLTDDHLELLGSARSTIGVGLQTIDAATLKDIKRPFKGRKPFEVAIDKLAEVAMTTVEVIVGLPEETPELFWQTFDYAMSLPVSVRVFQSLLLPDAGLRSAAARGIDLCPHSLRMKSAPNWPADVYRDTLRELHDRACDAGGWYSRQWPLPGDPDDPVEPLGTPIGGPMWTIADDTHENAHRLERHGLLEQREQRRAAEAPARQP